MDYPETNFVIAHCGCPWFLDAAEVIYKNANVWADLSGIFVGERPSSRPWPRGAGYNGRSNGGRGAGIRRPAGPVPVRQRLAAGPDGGVSRISRAPAGRPRMAGAPGRQRPGVVSRAARERSATRDRPAPLDRVIAVGGPPMMGVVPPPFDAPTVGIERRSLIWSVTSYRMPG